MKESKTDGEEIGISIEIEKSVVLFVVRSLDMSNMS